MSKNKSGRNAENVAEQNERERAQAGLKQKDEGERRRQDSGPTVTGDSPR